MRCESCDKEGGRWDFFFFFFMDLDIWKKKLYFDIFKIVDYFQFQIIQISRNAYMHEKVFVKDVIISVYFLE